MVFSVPFRDTTQGEAVTVYILIEHQSTIENTVAILTARFPQADVNTLKTVLDGITGLDRLKALNLHASLVSSLRAFRHELEG